MRLLVALLLSLVLHAAALMLSSRGGQLWSSAPRAHAETIRAVLVMSNRPETEGHSENLPAPAFEAPQETQSPSLEPIPVPEAAINPGSGYSTDYYFPRSALSRPAELIEDIDLSPLLADIGLLSHGVIVELFISESGLIDSVLIETTGVNDDLAERIRTLVSAIKFRAGELNGRPVKARTRIELYVSDPFPGKLPESHPANQK